MSDFPDRSSSGRAGELLAACRADIRQELLGWAVPAVEDATEALFQQGERARNTEIQTRLLGAVNILKKSQARFTDALTAAVRDRFESCLQTPLPTDDDYREPPLKLIDEEELEQTLAVSDIAAKAELRHIQELYGLNKRMTVLNRGRAVDNQTNPVGPLQLGRAIQAAANTLGLETPDMVVLMRAFDRRFMNQLGPCYQRLNEQLIQAGILPNLKFEAHRSRDPRVVKQEQAAPAPADRQPAQDLYGRSLADEVRVESAEVLERIRTLMAKMRRPPAARADDRRAVSDDQPAAPAELLDQALQQLQSEYAYKAQRDGVLDAEVIKERLAQWLAEQGKAVGTEQAETIDLMAMVYDYIRSELPVAPPVRRLVEQLQLPMMRMAITDRGFLADSRHPARRFFDTVADAGELWMDDEPEKSATFATVRDAVERILGDYRGDPEIFHQLLDDLRKHIAMISRKAKVAEKRHVEARKGQERLATARHRAQETIADLVEHYQPGDFARSMLEKAWVDYLALLHLRHGENSVQWKETVATARYLAVAMKGGVPAAMARQLEARLKPVEAHLRQGLGQVGYSEGEVEKIIARLEKGVEWSLKKKTGELPPEALSERVGPASERPPESESRSPRAKEASLSPEVKQRLARLRLTPFGTWFELRREQQGPWIKRKLSWYSPVSGHCLFVNHQGQPEEIDLITVAEMLVDNRARLFEPPKKPLMDRALNAVLGRLKRLTRSEE